VARGAVDLKVGGGYPANGTYSVALPCMHILQPRPHTQTTQIYVCCFVSLGSECFDWRCMFRARRSGDDFGKRYGQPGRRTIVSGTATTNNAISDSEVNM